MAARGLDDTVVLGELSLDGAVGPVRGVLPIAARTRRDGARRILLPLANAAEAEIVGNLEVLGAGSFEEVVAVIAGRRPASPPRLRTVPRAEDPPDLNDVRGQSLA